MASREISIWFFAGISLLGNGILVFAAGLYQWLHPPAHPQVVLFHLHANLWWGLVLCVAGLIYCVYNHPAGGRHRPRPHQP